MGKELPPRPSYNKNKETIREEDIRIEGIDVTKSQNSLANSRYPSKKLRHEVSTAMNSNVHDSQATLNADTSHLKTSYEDEEIKKLQKAPVNNFSSPMLKKELNKMLGCSPIDEEPTDKKIEIKTQTETKVFPRRGPSAILNKKNISPAPAKTPENQKKEQPLKKPGLNNFSKTKGLVNFTKLRYL